MASPKIGMTCNECGKSFFKTVGKNTFEAKCPKCGGYDTEPNFKTPKASAKAVF